jgi:hypothetical protein
VLFMINNPLHMAFGPSRYFWLYMTSNIEEAAGDLKQRSVGLECTNTPRSKSRKLRPIGRIFL